MNCISFADIFHGSGNIDLPQADGIAASWYFIKALCGNTHPGALLPFGKYSVCPYSGGYSSGYGTNGVNTHLPAPQIMDKLRLKGFSHFQNSGTGAIGVYYNYAVVTPYIGEKQEFYDTADESAEPGYYAVSLSDNDIRCELTAGKFSALHRYTFSRPCGKVFFVSVSPRRRDFIHLRDFPPRYGCIPRPAGSMSARLSLPSPAGG